MNFQCIMIYIAIVNMRTRSPSLYIRAFSFQSHYATYKIGKANKARYSLCVALVHESYSTKMRASRVKICTQFRPQKQLCPESNFHSPLIIQFPFKTLVIVLLLYPTSISNFGFNGVHFKLAAVNVSWKYRNKALYRSATKFNVQILSAYILNLGSAIWRFNSRSRWKLYRYWVFRKGIYVDGGKAEFYVCKWTTF